MSGIFRDLRKTSRDTLDLLHDTVHYTVLATDPSQCLVTVDLPLQRAGSSRWSWDDEVINVEIVDDYTITTTSANDLDFGHILCQQRVLSDTHDLHAELRAFWARTWSAWDTVDSEVWQRVTAFFAAYVPVIGFPMEPLTIDEWRRALRRFKPAAARGVDGISHLDLINAPMEWTQRLLSLLNEIELGQLDWPTVLLYGMVNLLAKEQGASRASRFRPIVVFSVIYRAWASLRARQLLRRLSAHMSCEAHGFRPGHETAQLWLPLQATIEEALQTDSSVCGLSTDLIRAFNNIPREQTFSLAEHLGVSSRVLVPWKAFLASCTRSFVVRGAHSSPMQSAIGMPEGDGLSVYAMLQLNFAWHLYMDVYAPEVRTLSFVDNLMMTRGSACVLARAWTCLETFFELWNLQVDVQKSHCWATTKRLRQQLTPFPFECVDFASELGGVLSFTKRQYTGQQLRRLEALGPRWLQLRSSKAPMALKLASIPTVFWTSGLHGLAGSCLGAGHLDSLRTQALKALRLNTAGTNSMLRLTLSTTPMADPGLWRLFNTVLTFRRLMMKDPCLMNSWLHFMGRYDGQLFSGPCSQLLVVLNQIGWQVQAPFVIDHDGFAFHLLDIDSDTLKMLLHDGWLQYVASAVSHRATMSDLAGLDTDLVATHLTSMTALDCSLMGALQSGAFLGNDVHSKYDVTKQACCDLCHVPDCPEHWLVCPRFQAIRDDIPNWQLQDDIETQALRTHLLPSRSPWAVAWKRTLLELSRVPIELLSLPGEDSGPHHLFSDGTCTGTAPFSYGAWGCINATTGALIAVGHLGGLRQHSARAELCGALAALSWQLEHRVAIHLWLDCKSVAAGIRWIQDHGSAGLDWHDYDLWLLIEDKVMQLERLPLIVHWQPSHIDAEKTCCPFEDWYCEWNNRIDRIVRHFNASRTSAFWQIYTAAVDHFNHVRRRFQQFRSFYFSVAALKRSKTVSVDLVEQPPFDFVPDHHVSLHDLYTTDPYSLIVAAGWELSRIPLEFMVAILSWVFEHSDDDCSACQISFVELTLGYAEDEHARFPFWDPQSRSHILSSLALRFERPTLSSLLKIVRDSFRHFLRNADCPDVLCYGLNKSAIGVIRPLDGLYVKMRPSLVQRCAQRTAGFFASRPYRKANDIARPV